MHKASAKMGHWTAVVSAIDSFTNNASQFWRKQEFSSLEYYKLRPVPFVHRVPRITFLHMGILELVAMPVASSQKKEKFLGTLYVFLTRRRRLMWCVCWCRATIGFSSLKPSTFFFFLALSFCIGPGLMLSLCACLRPVCRKEGRNSWVFAVQSRVRLCKNGWGVLGSVT